MRVHKLIALSVIICFFCGTVYAKPRPQQTLLSRFSEGVASVLGVIGTWNAAIDRITNSEVRRQLQRRMYRLYRDMEELERRKQNLLETVSADQLIHDNIMTDIDELRTNVGKIRQSLDGISATLVTEQSFDGQRFENLMEEDLNEKSAALIQARHEGDKDKLIHDLEVALAKIKDARSAVGQCLNNLQRNM